MPLIFTARCPNCGKTMKAIKIDKCSGWACSCGCVRIPNRAQKQCPTPKATGDSFDVTDVEDVADTTTSEQDKRSSKQDESSG